MNDILRGPRRAALVVISCLVAVSTLVAFGESYRALYLWASHHGVPGGWALIWPRWSTRSCASASWRCSWRSPTGGLPGRGCSRGRSP